MMPFLISSLGKELYGLWVVITSVVASYYLLDLGFNQAVTRYVAKYIHKNDSTSANRVINTALIIYSSLGAILFLFSVIAAYFFTDKLMTDSEHITLAQTILIISGLSIALEFPAKAFPGIISAYLRFDVIATVRFSKSIIDAIFIYLAISHGYGLVAMASITFFTGILSTLIYVRYSTSLFKDLVFDKSLVDKTMFNSIFNFSKWVFVFDLNAMIRDKMDIWFIAFYLGNSALPIYYVSVRLIDYALNFMQQATGFSGPIFTEYYVKNERELLARSFNIFLKVNIILGISVAVEFYLLGYGFIEVWMRGAVSTKDAFDCLMVLAIGRFMVYFTTPVQSFLMTINKHRIGAWVSLLETPLAVTLSCLLIPRFGLVGAALAITIPYVVGRLFFLPFFIYKYLEINLFDLVIKIVVFLSVSVFFAVLIGSYIPALRHLTFIGLFEAAIPLMLIQLLFSMLIWNSSEREWILQVLKKKFTT